MARGRRISFLIHLTANERRTLRSWPSSQTVPAGLARRGRMIVLVADGVPISHVAAVVGVSRHCVYKWVQRFLQAGLEGLADKPSRGGWRVACQPPGQEPHDMRA